MTPRSTKFYSLVSSGSASFVSTTQSSCLNSPTSNAASIPTSPLTTPVRSTTAVSRTNYTQVKLKNNLAQCGVVYSIVPTSVPSWLVLSSLKGVLDRNGSTLLEMTTNQSEVNKRYVSLSCSGPDY